MTGLTIVTRQSELPSRFSNLGINEIRALVLRDRGLSREDRNALLGRAEEVGQAALVHEIIETLESDAAAGDVGC